MIEDILKHNKQFVENKGYEKYITNKYPDKKIAILSCMDTRLTELLPAALGIKNGDVKMIKNAGGIISHPFGSVIRSLMVAIYELGVKEVMVIAHSDCGACHMSSAQMIEHMKARGIKQETIDMIRFCGVDFDSWLYGFGDTEKSVRETVKVILEHPLIPEDVHVSGFIIDSIIRSLESCGGINGYDYPYGCIPLTGYWREPSFFFHCICRPLPYDEIVLKAL